MKQKEPAAIQGLNFAVVIVNGLPFHSMPVMEPPPLSLNFLGHLLPTHSHDIKYPMMFKMVNIPVDIKGMGIVLPEDSNFFESTFMFNNKTVHVGDYYWEMYENTGIEIRISYIYAVASGYVLVSATATPTGWEIQKVHHGKKLTLEPTITHANMKEPPPIAKPQLLFPQWNSNLMNSDANNAAETYKHKLMKQIRIEEPPEERDGFVWRIPLD